MKKKAFKNQFIQLKKIPFLLSLIFCLFIYVPSLLAETGEVDGVNASCVNCPTGPVDLPSQAAVDAFVAAYPNCTTVSDLRLGNISINSDIHDLSGLSNLTTITVRLSIVNTQITSLAGLENLTTLNNLTLNVNTKLADISALSDITSINSTVRIQQCHALSSLYGLHNLESAGRLDLNLNTGLTNLDALSNLQSVSSQVRIVDNSNLSDCCAIYELLNTPGAIGGAITINNNQTSCDSQSEIGLYCTDDDMDGFNEIDGDCNDADTAIYPGAPEICDGLDNDCNGLVDDGPASVYNGNIAFYTQAQVDAWSPCVTTINGSVMISGYNITDLTPLANIQSITGNLNIQYTGLSSLSGLDNLQLVGGTVTILFNSSLSSLFGLQNLTVVGSSCSIYYNFLLSDCCPILPLLNGGGAGGVVSIFYNMTGCNNQAEILAQCPSGQNLVSGSGFSGNEIVFADASQNHEKQSVELYPNPAGAMVQVHFSNAFKQGNLEIFDAQGQLVHQQVLAGDAMQLPIETGKLPQGLYLVKVQTDEYSTTLKLMKQ